MGTPPFFSSLISGHSSSWEEHQLYFAFIAGWLYAVTILCSNWILQQSQWAYLGCFLITSLVLQLNIIFRLAISIIDQACSWLIITGLTLRFRGQGFPPATMSVAPSYLYNGKWKKSIITKRNRLLLHYLSDNPVLFSFLGLHPILHGPQLCLGP